MKKGSHLFVSPEENASKVAELELLRKNLLFAFDNVPRYNDVIVFSEALKILNRVEKKIRNVNKKIKNFKAELNREKDSVKKS